MAKKNKEQQVQSNDYLEFLRKRVNSANYRMSVSEQEYQKTVDKYNKEKLKLKLKT